MVQATVALRVDVDTRRGLEEGVPRLLELMRRLGVRASFFVTMGPERAGVAVLRAWRPSFLAKMWRTRALATYGLRTALSGTLLPARPVGAGAPELLRQVAAEGHEVAPHGHDHFGWQAGIHRWSAARVRADLRAAAAAYAGVFGRRPEASAAPGWRTTSRGLAVQDEEGLRYASDVRGRCPFVPLGPAGTLGTVQVPTTLPTADELAGRVRDIAGTLECGLADGLNVFALHAEMEGGPLLGIFADLLGRWRRRGVAFARLVDLADDLHAAALARPPVRVARGAVPGRSGWVAVQEPA